jgi:anti-anti-sigma regulatory factor
VLTSRSHGDALVLAGTIDEAATLVELVGRAKNGRLVLDLRDVTFINSVGVREWIRMQQAAQTAGIRIELRRVPEPVVHQLNIVVATRGVSIVTSFFAPYECDECEREEAVLLDVTLHGKDLAKLKAPEVKCPWCSNPMTFSDPPELYFSFLGA